MTITGAMAVTMAIMVPNTSVSMHTSAYLQLGHAAIKFLLGIRLLIVKQERGRKGKREVLTIKLCGVVGSVVSCRVCCVVCSVSSVCYDVW